MLSKAMVNSIDEIEKDQNEGDIELIIMYRNEGVGLIIIVCVKNNGLVSLSLFSLCMKIGIHRLVIVVYYVPLNVDNESGEKLYSADEWKIICKIIILQMMFQQKMF